MGLSLPEQLAVSGVCVTFSVFETAKKEDKNQNKIIMGQTRGSVNIGKPYTVALSTRNFHMLHDVTSFLQKAFKCSLQRSKCTMCDVKIRHKRDLKMSIKCC